MTTTAACQVHRPGLAYDGDLASNVRGRFLFLLRFVPVSRTGRDVELPAEGHSMKKVNPRKLRESLRLNQAAFWGRIEVTQSGGSRYENGRRMPGPVRKLVGIVYLNEKP
jgi:hypothetical protein